MRLWDDIFMDVAKLIKEQSDNETRHTSVVFVDMDGRIVASGANHSVKSYVLPVKRKAPFMEHAERNAIYNACERGVSLKGTTAYLPWFPCAECARALVAVGIIRMVCVEPDWSEEKYQFHESREILENASVMISFYKEEA